MRTHALLLWLSAAFASVSAKSTTAGNRHQARTNFVTEPHIPAVTFNISVFPADEWVLAPGYIFISNTKGPQIYDQNGNLIWYQSIKEGFKDQDYRPCDYLGQKGDHLCLHETKIEERLNTAKSRNIVFNSSYIRVGHRFTKGIDGVGPNLHAFHMLPGGQTFLQPVYVPREWDLSPYAGSQNGYIWDGCFQEIDVASASPLFEWCVSENLPLWQTSVFFTDNAKKAPPGQTNVTSPKAGRGTESFPFDFYHLNAIDKNSENDYLVSGRHFDHVLKIAGPQNPHGREPGEIIWQLGGAANDFNMKNLNFTKQHSVSYISTGASESVISLFDNAWDGAIEPSNDYSAGKLIKINNETMEAELLKEYPHPYGELAGSQGDMQLLPNNNVFIGWGELPEISEFDRNGTVLYHASFVTPGYKAQSYRAFKAKWTGRPLKDPKLIAYTQNCEASSPLTAYVSWNGDTEVKSWHFYVATRPGGPWIPAGTAAKTSFETELVLSRKGWLSPFMPYVSVNGYNINGRFVRSATTQTWVPPAKMHKCGKSGCLRLKYFKYEQKLNDAGKCRKRDVPSVIALIVLFLFVEGVVYGWRTLLVWAVEMLQHRMAQPYEQVGQSIQLEDIENHSTTLFSAERMSPAQ